MTAGKIKLPSVKVFKKKAPMEVFYNSRQYKIQR